MPYRWAEAPSKAVRNDRPEETMTVTARDIMVTRYFTLHPEDTITAAVRTFQRATFTIGKRVFGMMVTDDAGHLQGMLSMYDIMLFIRPKHIHIWGEMEDIDTAGLLEQAARKAENIQVGDIMTTDLVTVTPGTPLMFVLDVMLKKHIRRLPVLDGRRIVGIIYISNVFVALLQGMDRLG